MEVTPRQKSKKALRLTGIPLRIRLIYDVQVIKVLSLPTSSFDIIRGLGDVGASLTCGATRQCSTETNPLN